MIPAPDSNDPTLGQAAAALAAEEARMASEDQEPATQPTTDSATTLDRAEETPANGIETASPEPAGTPATEGKTETKPEQEPKRGADGKFVEKSRFAKSQERLQGTWKEVNTAKETIAKQQSELKAAQDAFQKQQAEFKAAQAKASQPKHQPGDYEAAAANWDREAEAIEARGEKIAKALEDKGEYDQADKRREQAKSEAQEQRILAKKAKAYAAELRANPPAAPQTDAQAEATLEASRKEWMSKAAIDFPATAKADSPEGIALRKFVMETPGMIGKDGKVADPQALYYAARLVSAETSAARVPAMEKELAVARESLRKLNEKLSISSTDIAGSPGGPRAFSEMSEAEMENQLRAEAMQRDRR